ncbi:N-6 DNA methylase [Staphylococcus saprophyticus]|uniref:N-6 DNA methylase n=1 Tax=Staphylococcus saprophyticus TaxID=29385 RepID=UPI001010CF79|nr:N-6 DNA methylase [Staphylococcus saprophyticus]MDW4093354.1 N-6 DNA methylase [Staphylococcus saprophyticus]RXS21395.1 SAM-dependent DNA methyltransferase [Staphylococcus saprophyticus]
MDDVTKTINDLLGIKDSYQAPQRIMDILYSGIEDRNKVFMNFLEAFDKDVTYDWFHDYFQDEHADRKKHKQDFTPQSISKLLGEIVGSEGNTYYEPAAGTGGILIERWNQDRMKHSPFDYEPRDYYYTAEELSDRAIPFLLFNMLIRGMNGNVVQCDVLTREATGAFFIQNDANDFMGFSSLNLLPYNEDTATELNINFIEEKYKPIKQTEKIPEWLFNDIEISELQS